MIRYLPEYQNTGFFDPYLLHELIHEKSGLLKPHFLRQTEKIRIDFKTVSGLLRKTLRTGQFSDGPSAKSAWSELAKILRWDECEFYASSYSVKVDRQKTSESLVEINHGSYRLKVPTTIEGLETIEVRLLIRPDRNVDSVLHWDLEKFIPLHSSFDSYVDEILKSQPNSYVLEFSSSGMTLYRRVHHRVVNFSVFFEKILQHKAAKERAERMLPVVFSPAFFTSELDLSVEKISRGDSFGRYPIEAIRRRFKDALEDLGQAYFELSNAKNYVPNPSRISHNRAAERDLVNQSLADQIKTESSRFIFRLLLLFAAEAKGYLIVPGASSAKDPLRSLGLTLLSPMVIRQLSARMCQTRAGGWKAKGTLLWDSCWALFEECRFGKEEGDLQIPAFNGQLFEPDRLPKLSQVAISDEKLAPIIDKVSRVDLGHGVTEFCDYANLRVNHLGEIYQWLLEFDAKVVDGPSVSVKENKGDLDFWISTQEAKKLEIPAANQIVHQSSSKEISFKINPKGTVRQKTGTHFTQAELADQIAFEGLREILADATKRKDVDRILEVSVLEPALGSAGILSAACRLMGETVFKIQFKNGDGLGRYERELKMQASKRRVLENCLYGVDRMVDAVELARSALWLEALSPELPLPFLDQKLRTGDSLIGMWFLHSDSFDKERAANRPLWLYPNLQTIKKLWNERAIKDHFNIENELIQRLSESWADWDRAIPAQAEIVRNFEKQLKTNLETRRKYLGETKTSAQVEAQLETARASIHEKLAPNRVRSGELVPLFRLKDKDFERELYELKVYKKLRTLGDLACALWFWPLDRLDKFPSKEEYQSLVSKLVGIERKPFSYREREQLRIAIELGASHCFFHWEVEFPELFVDGRKPDVCISNPPWDLIKLNKGDFLGQLHPLANSFGASRTESILKKSVPDLEKKWLEIDARDRAWAKFVKESGTYGGMEGDQDLYRPFLYSMNRLMNQSGAMLIPNGFWINEGCHAVRQFSVSSPHMRRLVHYPNTTIHGRRIFDGVHGQYSFGIAGFSKIDAAHKVGDVEVAFKLRHLDEGADIIGLRRQAVRDRRKLVPMKWEELKKISPSTAIPEVFKENDWEMLKALSKTETTFANLIDDSSCKGEAFGPDIFNSEDEDLVPVWKGTHFHIWRPIFQSQFHNEKGKAVFESCPNNMKPSYRSGSTRRIKKARLSEIRESYKNLRIGWRIISRSNDTRTLITAILPRGVACDESIYVMDLNNKIPDLLKVSAVMGSIVMDAQVRFFCAMNVNKPQLRDRFVPKIGESALWNEIEFYAGCLTAQNDQFREIANYLKQKDEKKYKKLQAVPRGDLASTLNGLVAAAYFESTKGEFGEDLLTYAMEAQFPSIFNSETQSLNNLKRQMQNPDEADSDNEGADPLNSSLILETFREWTNGKKANRR